ncbi:MAG TPA: MFS transporter [Thermoanaerobaculia bacterium]|nr:MFS transporter [Thermoanaerobaculia bacterium]
MPASAAAREPLLTAPFLRLWSFSFLAFFAAFQLFPTIPFRILELGGTRATAGSFLAVYTWASALSAPLTGAVADRFGRRRVLLAAGWAFVAASVAYGAATSLPLLLAAAVAHGVFWSGLLSASGALIAEVIPLSRRTEGLGYWGVAPTAAIAVAPAVGLWVYGFGWRAVTWEVAGLSLVLVALAAAVREGVGPARAPAGEPLVSWRVIASASGILVTAFGYGGITSYVALLSIERHIDPPSLFFTLFAVTVVLGRLLLVRHADRRRPEVLLYPSLLAIPPALALLAVASSRLSLAASAVLFGLGMSGAYPAFMTWVLGRTAPERRGATFGSVLLAMDAGIGLGSLTIGQLAEAAGYRGAFLAAAAVALLAVPLFLLARRLLPAAPPSEAAIPPPPPARHPQATR